MKQFGKTVKRMNFKHCISKIKFLSQNRSDLKYNKYFLHKSIELKKFCNIAANDLCKKTKLSNIIICHS